MDDESYHHGNLRQALIDAAIAAIRDGGAASVSLRALARDIGVSHAAPARHFATRDALFAAIAEQGYRELAERVAAARTGDGGPFDRLHRMARAHLAWVREHPALYAAMRNPEITRHADERLRHRMQAFAQEQLAFVRDARAGGWRQNEPAEVTMMSIVAGLTGIATVLTDPLIADILLATGPDRLTEALIDRLLAP